MPLTRTFLSIGACAVIIAICDVARSKEVCAPTRHPPLEVTVDLKYDEFRKKLIKSGWQPQPQFMNPMYRDVELGGQLKAMVDAGYYEVVGCRGTGLAGCEFEFLDVYGNRLIVETVGEVDEEHPFPRVTHFYFKCGSQPDNP